MREVLGQLAHVDLAAKEVKDIARPIPQAAFPPGSPARRLADVLVAQRLILADGGADGATLRVAHENLFEKWPAAKTLLAADRQARDLRSQLERQAKAWGAAEAGKAKRDLLLERAALANAVQLRKDRPDLVERAVVLTRGTTLAIAAPELTGRGAAAMHERPDSVVERDRIMRILKETNGRVGGPNGAALRLGLKRTTLITRMKKLGIDPRRLL